MLQLWILLLKLGIVPPLLLVGGGLLVGALLPDDQVLAYSQRDNGVTRYRITDLRRHFPITRDLVFESQYNHDGMRLSAYSGDGQRVAYVTYADGSADILLGNSDGTYSRNLTADPVNHYTAPAWSPDGTELAFVSNRDRTHYQLYIMRLTSGDIERITNVSRSFRNPVWSPDGRRLLLGGDGSHIWLINRDGSGLDRISLVGYPRLEFTWSPDSQQIAYATSHAGSVDIYVMDANGRNARNLTPHPATDFAPAWSPDGAHIAFISDRGGSFALYVMKRDGGDLRRLTPPLPAPPGFAWVSLPGD